MGRVVVLLSSAALVQAEPLPRILEDAAGRPIRVPNACGSSCVVFPAVSCSSSCLQVGERILRDFQNDLDCPLGCKVCTTLLDCTSLHLPVSRFTAWMLKRVPLAQRHLYRRQRRGAGPAHPTAQGPCICLQERSSPHTTSCRWGRGVRGCFALFSVSLLLS